MVISLDTERIVTKALLYVAIWYLFIGSIVVVMNKTHLLIVVGIWSLLIYGAVCLEEIARCESLQLKSEYPWYMVK